MPWKETNIMDERIRFISRLIGGETMTALCKRYEISRTTGYKFLDRYRERGLAGLEDESRRPHVSPFRIPEEVQQIILDEKKKHPTWGARKLSERLKTHHPGVRAPGKTTIHKLLKKKGLVRNQRRRRRAEPTPTPLRQTSEPNQVWCADYKGHFRLGNKKYCYPLTVTDHFSRYLLGCEAQEGTRIELARELFEEVFSTYGLPDAIRTDNGTPFASTGLAGLTSLSAWWLKLGIELERIEPGHPEQNGRHERMHLTLKQEATRPAADNHLQQQERFDRFREGFNEERPHEALGMATPASVYKPQPRPWDGKTPELEYPLHDDVRTVNKTGGVYMFRRESAVYISSALIGERIGLREVDDGLWLVSFASLDLGHIRSDSLKFVPLDPMDRG